MDLDLFKNMDKESKIAAFPMISEKCQHRIADECSVEKVTKNHLQKGKHKCCPEECPYIE